MTSEGPPQSPPEGPQTGGGSKRVVARRLGRGGGLAAPLVITCLILVLGFAPVSRLVAHDLPRPPRSAPFVTGPQRAKATAVQNVPVGLPQGAGIRTAQDVFPYAVAALGGPGAVALMAVLKSSPGLSSSPVGYPGHVEYPYRYPALDKVLNRAPPASFASGATALGAALTMLAAQPQDPAAGLAGTSPSRTRGRPRTAC